jgi:hypothetical protein
MNQRESSVRMVIYESGGLGSFEKSVAVVILGSSGWHEKTMIVLELQCETGSADESSDEDVFISDSPKNLVCEVNVGFNHFHYCLIKNMLLKINYFV